jgi:hypothetical protein
MCQNPVIWYFLEKAGIWIYVVLLLPVLQRAGTGSKVDDFSPLKPCHAKTLYLKAK